MIIGGLPLDFMRWPVILCDFNDRDSYVPTYSDCSGMTDFAWVKRQFLLRGRDAWTVQMLHYNRP